jgi:dihydrofolate synthase/folylpolyglutamate synthase
LRTPEGLQAGVKLAMVGQHQGGNAMVALGVLHQLRRQGFALSDEAIREGLETGRIAGRLEELLPGLFVDGAHNVDGTQALADYLATRPRPNARVLLFGMGEGRDPQTILKPLIRHVDEVVLTRGAHPKARDPLSLARDLADLDVALSVGGPIERALPEVYGEADETFVAGSLFLVGAVRALVAAGALEGLEPGQGLRQDLREIQLD